MGLFGKHKGFIKNFYDPLGIFGKRKGKGGVGGGSGGFDFQYSGPRPFTAEQVGLGETTLQPISKQYSQQLLERSRGQGLVGFDPRRRELLRSEFLADLGEQRAEEDRLAQARASSQGLRGGIPLTIAEQISRNAGRERTRGLSAIDIEDLEARREDINQATYAQPELVRTGSDIQERAAQFGLQEAGLGAGGGAVAEDGGSSFLPNLFRLGGTALGTYFGGPIGGVAGGVIGSTLGQQFKKSQYDPRLFQRRSTPASYLSPSALRLRPGVRTNPFAYQGRY